MVEFRALEALEYNPGVAGELENLVAPPYDVIDAAARKALAAKSPYNIVHISLPEASGGADKYQAAGALVADWVRRKVLVRSKPAFYVIEQSFRMAGQEFVRTGVLAQARLAPWREGGIYPHELTLPKPKADRLALYRATRVVPGPAFSLFEDKGGCVSGMLDKIADTPPYREFDGPERSHDRVWKVTDAKTINALVQAFAEENFYIADGHHRYETALAVRDELQASSPLPDGHPANFVLMCAVPFDDPGLVILPTHRLLALDDYSAVKSAVKALSADYELKKVASLADFARVGLQFPERIALYDGSARYLLAMKPEAREALRARSGEVMANLNVYEVLQNILPRFFKNVDEAIAGERVKYTQDVDEAIARVDSHEFKAAIILAPLNVWHLAAVAGLGKTMPPKSTYFFPKLPTGVAIKPLW